MTNKLGWLWFMFLLTLVLVMFGKALQHAQQNPDHTGYECAMYEITVGDEVPVIEDNTVKMRPAINTECINYVKL